jgi:hypothetical protein
MGRGLAAATAATPTMKQTGRKNRAQVNIDFDGTITDYRKGGSFFKLTLTCDGVPKHLGPQAAVDITEEFEHRPWHRNVVCSWGGSLLTLKAENDYDSDGLALHDEFSDAISACISEGFNGKIQIVSVGEL